MIWKKTLAKLCCAEVVTEFNKRVTHLVLPLECSKKKVIIHCAEALTAFPELISFRQLMELLGENLLSGAVSIVTSSWVFGLIEFFRSETLTKNLAFDVLRHPLDSNIRDFPERDSPPHPPDPILISSKRDPHKVDNDKVCIMIILLT